MKFDILILAAGFGSRLKSMTLYKPKAMIEYQSKKLIEIQLNKINKSYINKVIIVTGHKSSILETFLRKKFYNINFKFIKNFNYKKNSSGQSFYYAYNYIKTPQYIHLNCDCIYSKKHMNNLMSSNSKNIISVRSDIKLTDKSDNIKIYKNKIIDMSLIKKNESQFRGFGVAKISRNEMQKNVSLYKSLADDQKSKIKYFSLIRNNISGGSVYNILKTSKYNLAEINSREDKNSCKVIC
jgi:choline kinase